MVEYARRAQDDLGLEDPLQQIQHPRRQLELDSSSLPAVSDMSIHIVLIDLKISIVSFETKAKL